MADDLLHRSRNPYFAKLIEEGTSTAPISSHWQGAARLANALLGGLEMGRQDTKEAALDDAFKKFLGGGEPASPAAAAVGAPSPAMPAPAMPTRVTTGGAPIGGDPGYPPNMVGPNEGARTGAYGPDQTATFGQRFATPAPAGANAVPTVPAAPPADARNRAAASLLWAGGDRAGAINLLAKKPDAPTWGKVGTNQFGDVMGWIDPQARTTTAASAPGAGFKEATELRTELQKQPNYKKYQDAIGPYESMFRSAGLSTPASDLDLINGLAKILDPDSSVREGEFATVQKSQAIPERIKGQVQHLFEGKGALTPETRTQLMEIARNRVESYRDIAGRDVERYKGHAKRYGLDPAMVAYDIPETQKFEVKKPDTPGQIPKAVLDQLKEELKRRGG